MPRVQRASVRRLPSGRWQLRYYDNDGVRRSGGVFRTKSAAYKHFRDVIEPRLLGEPERPAELTLAEFADLYLERHAAIVRSRTIRDLRRAARLRDPPLRRRAAARVRAHERRVRRLAARLPARSRYGDHVGAAADARRRRPLGLHGREPGEARGPNPQPSPRPVRAYTLAELDALAAELSERYRPLSAFAAATGLRPQEWAALERRDVDRRSGVLTVRRTVSDGEIVELGKTSEPPTGAAYPPRARRARRAPGPARHAAPVPAPADGLLNLDNFRRREWRAAVEASGVAKPARIYDLRSTFASNALAAGVTVFELARVMGTSVAMIERHYGTLLDGAHAGIAGRLDALEAELVEAAESEAEGKVGS